MGSYAYQLGTLSAGSNYELSLGGSEVFAINKAPATLTLTNLTGQVYDGSGKAATVTTTPAGLSGVSVLYNGAAALPTEAGSYPVTATLTNPNYTAPSVAGTLRIDPAPATLTLTAADLLQTYTGQPKTVGATVNPSAAGVLVRYSQNGTPVAAPTQAGSYQVTATLTNPNYQLTEGGQPVPGQQVVAELLIQKAAPVITWSTPADVEYGTPLGSSQLNAILTTGDGTLTYQPAVGTVLAAGTHPLTVQTAATANYQSATATVPLLVTRKPLTPGITAESRNYNRTATATITSRTLTGGLVGTDAVTLTGGTATFPDAHVGTGRLVTATDLQLAGPAADNYRLTTSTATTTADIRPLLLTGSFKARDKVYDGTTDAAIQERGLEGVLAPDNVTLLDGEAAFLTKTVGQLKPVSGTGFQLGGSNASDYQLAPGSLTTQASIGARDLTGRFTAGSRPYDGTTTAVVTSRSLTGVLAPDAVTLLGGSAQFDTPQAGPDKPVTLSGATLDGPDAGNYHLAGVEPATATIETLGIEAIFTAADKTYDGTPDATVLTRELPGVLPTDNVTLTGGTASFADKTAAQHKPVTLTGASLGGAQAANYTLRAVAPARASINPRQLAVTAQASSREYNGSTAATVALQDNRLGGDQLTLAFTGATFDTKHVGEDKPVTVTGISASGPDAPNYAVPPTAATTATITARALLISLQAEDKVYDGTTVATAAAQLAAGSGLVPGDAVTVAGANAQFDTPAAGPGKPVTASVSKAGADAGNYTANSTAATTAAIIRRPLTAGLTGQVAKQYDQTTTAALTPENYTLENRIDGDAVGLNNPAGGQYDTRHVGEHKTVSVSGLLLTGAAAGNYSLPVTSLSAPVGRITERPLLLTAAAQDKVYDGSTTATISLTDDRLSGDQLTATYTSAAFASKQTGSGKQVTVSGLSIIGPDAGNYTANTSATTTATINQRALTGTIAASNKVYDGTRAATATASLSGPIPADDVAAEVGNAQFDTPSVGPNKPVSAALTLTGSDAPNYTVNATAATTAAIVARQLTATLSAQSRPYDGTTAATATAAVPPASLVPGDVVTVTVSNAQFDTRWAGPGKPVQATVALSGPAAPNYVLSDLTAATTADITQLGLTGTFTAQDKEYDGTVAATITGRSLPGVLPIDAGQVNLVGGSATFTTPAVGTGKPVTATGLSLSGPAAPNYALLAVAPTKASITGAVPGLTVAAAKGQYSDKVLLVATLSAPAVQNELNSTGGTVEFRLKSATGDVVVLGSTAYPGGWAVLSGKATARLEFTIQQAPGTYTVQAFFTPNAGNIGAVSNLTAGTLTVKPEDAELTYTGDTYYTLPSATATSFNLLLSASVKDITTLPADARTDAWAGNISNARVQYRLGSPTGPLLGSTTVALVSPSDAQTGLAAVQYTCPISSANQADGGLTLTVYPVVTGFYSDSTLDPVTITLSLPGADFVTGGGHLVNTTASRGTLAGTAGAKTNFGFTIKYTRSGTNPKGQCTIIVRSAGRVYQIKSTAIYTLSVGTATTVGTPAYFNTKANYTDITDPLNPVPGPGNLDLTVWMNDLSAGGQGDAVGIQLLNGSQLLYASNWNGTKTVTQGLGGGNVQVRNTLASATTSTAAARPAEAPVADATVGRRGTLLAVYPNPVTTGPTRVHFRSGQAGRAQLLVYNEVGALVATLHDAEVSPEQDVYVALSAETLPNGLYLCRLVANGRVHTHRFVVSH